MPCEFAALPDDVLYFVFAALPADARVRCALVCRAWAHALLRGADTWRAWTRLDLSLRSGMTCTRSDAVLAGAAALARGHLQELDLGTRGNLAFVIHGLQARDGITLDAVLGVLRSSPQLRELALDGVDGEYTLPPEQLQQLLAAAPSLQWLDAEIVRCESSADRLPLLRAEPPYEPLCICALDLHCTHDPPDESLGNADVARVFGAALARSWVRKLELFEVLWLEPAALEALTDALLSGPSCVRELSIFCSFAGSLSRAFLPAVARLFAGRDGAALTSVGILGCMQLFEGATEAELAPVCAALRGSRLQYVEMSVVGLTEQGIAALRDAASENPRLYVDIA